MRLDLCCILILSAAMTIRPVNGQSLPPRIVSGDFQRFEVDNLGNIYTITLSNQLRKYSPDGDSVSIVKDLPVKGFSKAIKVGTKVTNIRLVEGDHNIDCKVPGFGAMALKSEFVKKV